MSLMDYHKEILRIVIKFIIIKIQIKQKNGEGFFLMKPCLMTEKEKLRVLGLRRNTFCICKEECYTYTYSKCTEGVHVGRSNEIKWSDSSTLILLLNFQKDEKYIYQKNTIENTSRRVHFKYNEYTVAPPYPWFHFLHFQLLMVKHRIKIVNGKFQ